MRVATSKSRPGVTLIEVMIFSAIGVGLLGIFYSFFSGSHKKTQQMTFKAKGTQDAHLFLQRLRGELKEAVVDEQHPLRLLNVGSVEKCGVRFWRVEDAPSPSQYSISQVTYLLDPKKRIVTRNGKRASKARICKLRFEKVDRKPGPSTENSGGNFLLIAATGIPDELAHKDIDDIPANQRSTLMAAVGLYGKTLAEIYKYWAPLRSIGPLQK